MWWQMLLREWCDPETLLRGLLAPLCVEGKAQYSCLKKTSRETFHCAKDDHNSKTQVPYLCFKTKAIT